ncbi:MAG: cell envelope integrity protein TolA [Burkholderiaceae bacterium]|nr:cell envelope integrity protein TolA [Burkholderiaceae bacterium]
MPSPQHTHTALKPPAQARWGMPVVMALAVHSLLVLALTWGVAWQQTQASASFDVELWSDIPVASAPPAPEPPPKPPPEPPPQPEPPQPAETVQPAEPAPAAQPAPPPEPQGPSAADIALEKQRALEAQEKQLAEKLAREKAAQEKAAKDKAEKEKAAREKAAEEKAAKEKAAKEKAAAQQRAAERARKEQAQKEQALKDQLRKQQLERLSGLAGKAGQTGSAARASGPSATYAGRVVAAIRPNIVFTDVVAGNPAAEVEVTTQPTGEIIGRKLLQSSGSARWDEAVLRAIDRTVSLPRDTNGTVPSPMIIRFRPKD